MHLRGVIVDWGGVMTSPILDTVNVWLETDGIDRSSYLAVMRPWVMQAYAADQDESPIHALERGECEDEEMTGRGWVDQAQDRLIRSYASRDEDRRHDGQAGQALGALGAHRERDTERDRGQRVPAVVDQVGQQRQAAGDREHERLHHGCGAEDGECEHDGPDALA